MRCKFRLSEIERWAREYGDPADDADVEHVGAAAKARGYVTHDELIAFAHWKSPRIKRHIAANDAELVCDVTRLALSTSSERLRIEVLTLIRGVGWPMASVLLHFCHVEDYPILDVRALWSLGEAEPRSGYNFAFWCRYFETCRSLAARAHVSMRTLDRALWGYSKVNQQ